MNPICLCILLTFVLSVLSVEAIAESPQKTLVDFKKIGTPIQNEFLYGKLSKLPKLDLSTLKEKNADKVGTLSEKVKEKKTVKLPTGEKVEVGITEKKEVVILSAGEKVKTKGKIAIPEGIDLRKVEERLFDVEYLLGEGYSDSESIPVIVVVEKDKVGKVEKDAKSLGRTKKFEIIPAVSLEVKKGENFKKLLSIDGVKKVWVDAKVKALLSESVPLINASQVWELGYNGSGVKIAILDTGINSSHGDFYFEDGRSKIIYSVDLTNDGTPKDLHGHGTHVASISVGTGRETGLKGVAPGAYLMNVKVLNKDGEGLTSWIIRGIEYAVGNGSDIISMSLGSWPTIGDDPLSLACDAAVESGVTVVVAAGNFGNYYMISTPGSAKKVITVGATDKSDNIAEFSSRGPTLDHRVKPEVVAPGVGINASNYLGGATIKSGTSMATPHVSGLVALLKQAKGNIDPETVKNIIASTAVLLDLEKYNVFDQGAGRINALAAIKTELIAEPAVVSLGVANQNNFTISFRNLNSTAEIPISITANSNCDVWMNRTELTVPANSKAEIEVGVTAGNQQWCSGAILTNYTVSGSAVHAVFGMVVPVSEKIEGCKDIKRPGYYWLESDVYGLQANKNYCIGIFVSDVVIEGNGYSISGSSQGTGIYVNANNITMSNVNVFQYGYGIYLLNSNNTTILNSTTSNNALGIFIESSGNNTITDSIVSYNGGGIFLWNSNNNIITNCTISTNSGGGIFISHLGWHLPLSAILINGLNNVVADSTVSNNGLSVDILNIEVPSDNNTINNCTVSENGLGMRIRGSNNTISKSKIISNNYYGIGLWASSNNKIEDSRIENNGEVGIYLEESTENTITNTTVSESYIGIELRYSSNNKIENNTFRNCGIFVYESYDNTVLNNYVNRKPLVYLENVTQGTVENAGQVILVNSENVIITNLQISNTTVGIELWNSSNVRIENSNLLNNGAGIVLLLSKDNIITNCTIVDNKDVGVYLGQSNSNLIYNNLFNNTNNVTVSQSANMWNTTHQEGTNILGGNLLGGNAWLSLDGTGFSQTCADVEEPYGICDGPFVIDDNNVDYLPLKYPQSVIVVQSEPTPTPTRTPTTITPRPIVGGGGGGGGGGVIPGVPIYVSDWIRLKANSEAEFTMPQSAFWETNVFALILLSDENVNAKLRIEKKKELPPDLPAPSGIIGLILSIEPTLSTGAKVSGRIQFGISIVEIKAKGFDPNLVVVIMLKWDGKQWIELPTKFLSSDGRYNYYEAETPSFSYFVAILKPLETPTPTTPITTPFITTTPTVATTPAQKPFIPGFEAVFAIAGLIAIAYLLRRKS